MKNYLERTDIINNKFIPQKTSENTRITLDSTLILPVLLHDSENWTNKATDARRITAAQIKYMRKTAGYTWIDFQTNTENAK